jgi:putative ABC transport system permease protein
MIKNYIKIAWRNLVKSNGYSALNIGGLAVGMAVALAIGLWIWDEVTYDRYNRNYDRIAQVYQNQDFGGEIATWQTMPYPMGETLRREFPGDFKHVVMASWDFYFVLTSGDKHLKKLGKYMEPGAPEMLDLQMISGSRDALKDPSSIILSASAAKDFFGDQDPMGKTITLTKEEVFQVQGVYKDLPRNSIFSRVEYLMPFEAYTISRPWMKTQQNPWGNNSCLTYVQLADHADIDKVTAKIKDVRLNHLREDEKRLKPALFLHPMRKWRLETSFKNGVVDGGSIRYVWMFGIIGTFVLLLACINFMNLSTARSEKRAREVGIRKAVGSVRGQLIKQFFSESLLVVAISFVLSLMLVAVTLRFFNTVTGKEMHMPWGSPLLWLAGVGISVVTALIAGSYPAFYLSSFQPVKVLKGTFRAGRYAAVPRKVLVVAQFSISLVLIIGTMVVFKQIQFAQNRPVGYDRNGLVMFDVDTRPLMPHINALEAELLESGVITGLTGASSPITTVWSTQGDISWKGKPEDLAVDWPNTVVRQNYGKVMGWKFAGGRDFSKDFASDSSAVVINEAAASYMGMKNPVGETIRWNGGTWTIIGVIKDIIAESPYAPVRAALYNLDQHDISLITVRVNPKVSMQQALKQIEAAVHHYDPGAVFGYKFVDDDYATKFADEQRIGKLVGFFAGLAIFICCLGLLGMASFMAERRTKEIGVRKVLGASVLNLWGMLSKDFLVLVLISMCIAMPFAYYLMHGWLAAYQYRSAIPWWIFVAAGGGVLMVTLLTVSFQSLKAALMNPVKSLRTE